MARLVMVSNRVTTPGRALASAGGLSIALLDVLRKSSDGVWFGWSGKIASRSSRSPHVTKSRGVTYITVDLGKHEHNAYYSSYSNGTLWPLLHYRLALMDYKRRSFEGYQRVNAYFAKALAPFLKPADIVWVHDYQLIPLGTELRALGIKNRIGFFLHTPFPAAPVFAALPHHERVIGPLADYDLIGLQTADDVAQFLRYITEIAGGRCSVDGSFRAFGKRSRVAAFPVGIDTAGFADMAQRAEVSIESIRLKQNLANRALIIGVDRLDYSKALPNRFEAIETLLSDWPSHRGQFTYLQIAPHSRSEVAQYQDLRRRLEGAAGRVNGKFADVDWTPIRYVNKNLSRSTLAGLYRQARVGLVTPFRDGMNLVAKEFVAAQDPADPGVLILSEFAGAARELSAALLVNPYDIDGLASALHNSLEMPLHERRKRWKDMMQTLHRNTVWSWCDSFLHALTAGKRVTR